MLFLSGLVTSGVTFSTIVKNDLSTDAVDKGMSVAKLKSFLL